MGSNFAKSHIAILTCIVGLTAGNIAPAFAFAPKAAIEPVYGKAGWQEDFIARSIVRTGLLDLRLRTAPSPDDYRLLAHLFGIAQSFSPKDADIVRRTVEAAHNARDAVMLENATRTLVQLDPTDTVAQLRLISGRISRLQTADERLKQYAVFLGEKGNSLDGSIRSRLALDAAMLAREQGDDAAFIDYLKAALRLDSTNKEAALIAFGHFSEKVNDPAGRVQLLSNLLLADPLDPNVHRQLSQEMAAGGAYVQAKRFHDISSALFNMAGARSDDHFAVETWIGIWAVEGNEKVLAEFEKLLSTEKYRAAQAAEQARKELREVTTNPDEIRLSPAVDRVRLFAADSAQDQKTLESVRESLTFADVALVGLIEELKKPDAKATPEEVMNFRYGSAIGLNEIQLLRLWVNMDIDKATASLARAPELLGDQEVPDIFAVVKAWVLMREGKLEEALAAFELLQDTEFEHMSDRSVDELDPARIGKAMTLELMGRAAESAEIYKAVAIRRAFDASGMWCKLRLERMGGSDPQRDALAKQLTTIGEAVPRLVEELVQDPSTAVALSADVPVTLSTPLDRSDLIIKIRNKTKIPLGLGSDRTINSRFLVQPSVDIHTQSQTSQVQPEVLDLDRRMRLQPGETLEVRVRADAGYTGWLIESGAGRVVRSRFRIMQGFTAAQDGTMNVGPGCLAADSPQVIRNPLKEALLPVPDMVDRIKLATGEDCIALLLGLKAKMLDSAVGSPEREALAAVLASRYPSMAVRDRIVALVEVPNAAMYEEFRVFDEVARKETAAGAAGLAIVTRITDPSDPALAAALTSPDAVTREIASIHKLRLLELDAATLSRRGFGKPPETGPGIAPPPTATSPVLSDPSGSAPTANPLAPPVTPK